MLRKCMSGRREEGLFSRGSLTEYSDEGADEEMKVQTSSLQHFSPLLSSPYTLPIWPVALFSALLVSIIISVKPAWCPFGSASSQGWLVSLAFPSQLSARNTCSHVAP